MSVRKKLIEVALPLESINVASAKEKSIRHGHPSTLHLWWARRPLAACRAVLFASLVDDPSARSDEFPTEEVQEAERQRLFHIIERLVQWENTTNKQVLEEARAEIRRSTGGNPPPVLDPFCGGGSIPLEAQRLGLEAHASDLNPVAVLITKALIEIPPKFAGRPPVHPDQPAALVKREWRGAQGLAEDVRYYGKWMRDEAERRIGHLYPKVQLPPEHGGGEATVIAWLWARTVKCPNPACGTQVPLVRSFALATKKGREAWIEPTVDRMHRPPVVQLKVRRGKGIAPEGTMKNRIATCLGCSETTSLPYIRAEAQAGRMGVSLIAIIAEGLGGPVYCSSTPEHEARALSATPAWKPSDRVTTPSHEVDRLPMYGMYTWGDAFSLRQLTALTTFSDLVHEARDKVRRDAVVSGLPDDGVPLTQDGAQAAAYAEAVATYLAFAVDRSANYWSRFTPWGGQFIVQTFGRQAIPMVWDSAEGNPFSSSTGNWLGAIEWITKCLEVCVPTVPAYGLVTQRNATTSHSGNAQSLVCTDPPYYDNVGYADLSDYFYVWLRHSLGAVYPSLFSTVLTPKADELVAMPHRFNSNKREAERFFQEGLGQAFARMRDSQHPDYPLTLFYAFKQSETDSTTSTDGGGTVAVASTGWETMLEGLLGAGFAITGTWPSRTERDQGLKSGTNVLASSIILVCRSRPAEMGMTTRRAFLTELKRELPGALRMLQHGNIAPVDLAQAAIGPGMAVFSRYSKVLESDGQPMRVRTALQLINQVLDEVLAEQEGEFDADTRWAIAWFEQHGLDEGLFGQADVLARAKNTAVARLADAGILLSRAGKVRLLRRDEFAADWDPLKDRRLTVWEVTQHLIRALDQQGEQGTAALLRRAGAHREVVRDLAYRLYTTCERKGWAQEALAYNSLVAAWPELSRLAGQPAADEQMTFLS